MHINFFEEILNEKQKEIESVFLNVSVLIFLFV